jgi:hypothetical protein
LRLLTHGKRILDILITPLTSNLLTSLTIHAASCGPSRARGNLAGITWRVRRYAAEFQRACVLLAVGHTPLPELRRCTFQRSRVPRRQDRLSIFCSASPHKLRWSRGIHIQPCLANRRRVRWRSNLAVRIVVLCIRAFRARPACSPLTPLTQKLG